MKFIHTADWHLGKLFYGGYLTEEQEWILKEQFIPLVDEEKPDVILLAGDVYDRSVPPAEASVITYILKIFIDNSFIFYYTKPQFTTTVNCHIKKETLYNVSFISCNKYLIYSTIITIYYFKNKLSKTCFFCFFRNISKTICYKSSYSFIVIFCFSG